MIFWLIAVVIIVIVVLIVMSGNKRRAVVSTEAKTHKECSYCNEEIEMDATVCKYCRGVVVNSN
ncbi:hypothetical protein [Paenibacillus planticolens]|uniref:Zinc ribbon domain-containing protein n=1 Tax=Paenibacillus planticolens TaxID=2654976 RepID=A0ABX1ZV56_9BACL|nr:hypothetical protein [Paenibacillus planticolens]NOV03940.1 hypothetical protein [Paenibacillus planticolens]